MDKNFTVEDVKRLRELTGVGLTDAKKALEECTDFEAALKAMKAKGLNKVVQRSSRVAKAGIVASYVHDGRIGVLVEVNCETEFVAKTENFLSFVRDLSLQIAASDPEFLEPDSDVAGGGEIDHEQALLSQTFIKDPKLTIKDLLQAQIAKLGENIVIARFVRFELGDDQQRLVLNTNKG